MKITIAKIMTLGLLAAAMAASPLAVRAQDAPASAPAKSKGKKSEHLVFNGKVTGVDTNALTLTVGKRTFEITSDTKINKHGKPATLAEGVVGEPVAGSYKQGPDGKLTATTVNFGAKSRDAKTTGDNKKKKKESAEGMEHSSDGGTN